MPKECEYCHTRPAQVRRPKNLLPVCLPCFYELFEHEVHLTITQGRLFERGERVAIGASGGKDSTVLIHVLKLLNEKFDYGLDLVLLSIDEGIKGSPFVNRLQRRLLGDRQEKHTSLQFASHHYSLQTALRMDNGRGSGTDRS
jgi:tRNA(Ile)-lysidine synthase TilS/MesJ